MKVVLIALMLMLNWAPAHAIDTEPAFDDPLMQERYEKIISEVRCAKCQNQTIKDSNAFLAADLRREIRELLREGKSDAEVYDFLVARYGEFVLYRPKASGKTLILWIAPGLLVLGGLFLLVRILRRRMSLPIDESVDDDAPARG